MTSLRHSKLQYQIFPFFLLIFIVYAGMSHILPIVMLKIGEHGLCKYRFLMFKNRSSNMKKQYLQRPNSSYK